MLYQNHLAFELVSIINQKNGSSLRETDLSFEFLSREPTGEITVKVTPAPGVAYYGEQTLTYVRRDLSKAMLNVPLRLLVAKEVTVSELVQQFSTKYGFSFDTALDFLQSELDKTVDFSGSGVVQVTIPSADTSNVWIGDLVVEVTNDALNLETIIANFNLQMFTYWQESPDTAGSLDIATLGIMKDIEPDTLVVDSTNVAPLSSYEKVTQGMVDQGMLTEEERTTILAGYADDASRGIAFIVNADNVGYYSEVKRSNWVDKFNGFAYLGEAVAELPARYVFNVEGGQYSNLTLDMKGWSDVQVDWGDGTQEELTASTDHKYPTEGNYTAVVTGTVTNANAVQTIRGYGVTEIVSWENKMNAAPQTNNLQKLVKVPNSIPQQWTSLQGLFQYAILFNGPEVIDWDTSNIYTMDSVFLGASKFNQPIGNWNVSKVTSMNMLFSSAGSFNQPINDWDVSNVRDMGFLFSSANAFNQPLDKWNTSRVTTMTAMFSYAKVFDQPIGMWDVGNVTSMSTMFSRTEAFNQDIGSWNTARNKTLVRFMENNTVFDQDLSGWDISSVTSGLDTMANGATAWAPEHQPGATPAVSKFFKAAVQPGQLKLSVTKPTDYSAAPWYKLGVEGVKTNFTDGMIKTLTITEAVTIEVGWNDTVTDVRVSVGGDALVAVDQFDSVGNVTQYDFQRSPNLIKVPDAIPASVLRTSQMFYYCTNFNGAEVVGWDVSHITAMGQMFQNATTFNQDLSAWNTAAVTNNTWFADGATAWEAEKQPAFPNVS